MGHMNYSGLFTLIHGVELINAIYLCIYVSMYACMYVYIYMYNQVVVYGINPVSLSLSVQQGREIMV